MKYPRVHADYLVYQQGRGSLSKGGRKALFISVEHRWTLLMGTWKSIPVRVLPFATKVTFYSSESQALLEKWHDHIMNYQLLHRSVGKGLFIRIQKSRKEFYNDEKKYRGKYCLFLWVGKYETIWISQDYSIFIKPDLQTVLPWSPLPTVSRMSPSIF